MSEDVTKNLFINLTDPVIFQTYGGEEYWEKVDVPAGQVVLQEGEESTDFYYVFSGAATVVKAQKTQAGLSEHLGNLQTGDFFGEGALLSEEGRGATVTATSDCVLLKLSKENFDKLVLADAQAAVGLVLGIVKVLNARLQAANEKLA
jgi:CRP-like cAMP-binding protein